MHIKRVILEGFKTYKERTEFPEFSEHVNAVLGKNGSGKSNLLDAIAFVLSDKYSRGGGNEDPKTVIYSGAGRDIIAASVEIVFDNTDSRMPVDRDEVRIKRTVGQKKDEYFIDDVNKSHSDVIAMLEAAGLSRSNPYNIVQQGKIAELIRMSNAKRLSLLKEIAGTRTYDERRAQSQKIMKDTDVRRADIDEVIEYLDNRLGELEDERKELKEFESLDTQRRTIEFSIYEREREHATRRLAELEESVETRRHQSTQLHDQLSRAESEREEKESQYRDAERRLKRANADRKKLSDGRKSLLTTEKEAEMAVREAEEKVKNEQEKHSSSAEELMTLNTDIEARESDLARVNREYSRLSDEESELKRTILSAKQKLDSIYAKQSRKSQFKTKQARDKHLTAKKKEFTELIRNEEQKLKELKEQIRSTQLRVNDMRTLMENKTTEIETLKSQLESNHRAASDLKSQREDLNHRRKECQRRMAETESEDSEQLDKVESSLLRLIDSDTWRGIQTVSNYVRQHPDMADSVHGIVLDLLTMQPSFHRAVESVIGKSLFHMVVRDDTVAAQLITVLKDTPRGGRLTFVPLNRVKPPKAPALGTTSDAVPLIERVSFDERFTSLMRSQFGRVLVCRDLKTCGEMTQQHNVTTVTLDGNKVDQQGALSGGYIDAKKSRIAVYQQYKSIRDTIDQSKHHRQELKTLMGQLDLELSTLLNAYHRIDEDNKAIRRSYDKLTTDIKALDSEVHHEDTVVVRLQGLEKSIAETIELNRNEIDRLSAELESPFSDELTAAEQRELSETVAAIQSNESRLSTIVKQRVTVENDRSKLQAVLTENLYRRRAEYMVVISGLSLNEANESLARLRDDMSTHISKRKELDDEIAKLDNLIEALLVSTKNLQSAVDELRQQEFQARENFHSSTSNMEKILADRMKYETKRVESARKIRELGSVSLAGVSESLKAKTNKQLLAMVESINQQLLNFSHINKKASDQYLSFTEQRQDLIDRANELNQSRVSIEQLIQHLDAKKDEAIQRTFKQIGQNFSIVFRELVPGGEGTLVIETATREEEEERELEEETESEREVRKRKEREEREFKEAAKKRSARGKGKRKRGDVVERKEPEEEEEEEKEEAEGPIFASKSYTGVGIKVRFPGAATDTHQLSGGQESVVALSLIFAIQRCDPSPFYVFDEIDSALDPVHRTAVAELIDRQRRGAQFIVTTFSRELIEHADKFYGVIFQNKVSKIKVIDQSEALRLVAVQESEHAELDQHGA